MSQRTIAIILLFYPVFTTASTTEDFQNRLPRVEDKQVVWQGEMTTTRYSAIDSCHYAGCPTASGSRPTEMSVACPRSWKLGSIVEIDEQYYRCDDRYNADLSDRIDIWTGWDREAYQEAIKYGKQIKIIKLLK